MIKHNPKTLSELKNNIQFNQQINNLIKFNKIKPYIYLGTFSYFFLTFIVLIVTIFSFTILDFTLGIKIFLIIIFLILLTFFIIYTVINKNQNIFKLPYKKVQKYIFEELDMSTLYNEFLNQYDFKDDIKDVQFIFKKNYQSKPSFYKNDIKKIFEQGERNTNYLMFKYKNNICKFIINKPIIETKKINEKETITIYKINYTLKLETKKYDESFNNIKIIKHSLFKNNYKTESTLFNKKYSVITKNNNLNAALVLSPKAIDKLSNIKNDIFDEILIDNGIYVNSLLVTENYKELPIGFINLLKIISHDDFINEVASKIESDLNDMSIALKYIEALI
ncbi:hypothetical protein [Spiroplasma turonicum]|uniref:Galanin n=1 Tax=Spiroplasma turonicum TaxID=216946 RepID=A0A0K1P733_9MOLU|nr:hypothetical protein [Spiroplasma turonicum]AKU80004.1 hypothetical protein STURON_00758 [Spiroplasma turonicum]ALX71006.1 hypothetical protein STURO_v1c07550 [Spiroplasma turonicum]